jgi:hypothetical protein
MRWIHFWGGNVQNAHHARHCLHVVDGLEVLKHGGDGGPQQRVLHVELGGAGDDGLKREPRARHAVAFLLGSDLCVMATDCAYVGQRGPCAYCSEIHKYAHQNDDSKEEYRHCVYLWAATHTWQPEGRSAA